MRKSRFASLLTGLLLAVAMAGTTLAQTTAGNISGEAKAGETVVINGPDTGFHREIEIEEDGKYKLRHVPAGSYTVVTVKADGTIVSSQSVVVTGGRTSRVM